MSSKDPTGPPPPDYDQAGPSRPTQGQGSLPWVPPSQPYRSYSQQYPPSPYMQGQLSNHEIARDYQAQLFARCAQGIHEPTTRYGLCGIITAVVCFPIGLICLFIDTEQKCSRCGVRL